ncbi:hypothetical protein LJR221_001458 [Agrobacterium tumefaciens]
MKREDSQEAARREADMRAIRAAVKRREPKTKERRRLAFDGFDPMAIAWGDVKPQPPPDPFSRKSKPKRKEK